MATAEQEHGIGPLDADLRHVVDGLDRRHEPGAALLHQAQRAVAEIGSVLDTAHACEDGGPCALVAVGVRHHGHAARSRRLDDHPELRLGVDLLAWIGVGQAGALGAAGLDPVHPVIEIDLHESAERLGSADAVGERHEPRIGEHRLAEVGRHVEP